MGELENPLPEVDQDEHPLRVLSQENLTTISTFTGIVNSKKKCSPFERNMLVINHSVLFIYFRFNVNYKRFRSLIS